LAAQFPNTFVANKRAPHRPLAIGIGAELLARGIIPAEDLNGIMRCYTSRLAYQQSVWRGGARFGLDGNAQGVVTETQREFARLKVLQKLKAITERQGAERRSEQNGNGSKVTNAANAATPRESGEHVSSNRQHSDQRTASHER
jgi:sRNA-binding protein